MSIQSCPMYILFVELRDDSFTHLRSELLFFELELRKNHVFQYTPQKLEPQNWEFLGNSIRFFLSWTLKTKTPHFQGSSIGWESIFKYEMSPLNFVKRSLEEKLFPFMSYLLELLISGETTSQNLFFCLFCRKLSWMFFLPFLCIFFVAKFCIIFSIGTHPFLCFEFLRHMYPR